MGGRSLPNMDSFHHGQVWFGPQNSACLCQPCQQWPRIVEFESKHPDARMEADPDASEMYVESHSNLHRTSQSVGGRQWRQQQPHWGWQWRLVGHRLRVAFDGVFSQNTGGRCSHSSGQSLPVRDSDLCRGGVEPSGEHDRSAGARGIEKSIVESGRREKHSLHEIQWDGWASSNASHDKMGGGTNFGIRAGTANVPSVAGGRGGRRRRGGKGGREGGGESSSGK